MKKVLSLVLAFIMTFALIPFSAFAESADVCEFVSGSDGTLEYYVNGVKQSDLGLIELDGDYYYVNSNGVVAVGEYWVTKDNGFGYVGIQQFGTDGKMVVKNGIVAEDDGSLAYYIANAKQYGLGLIELDGDYYYVNSNGVVVVGEYWVTMDNGLGYVGVQQFDSDGKMTVVEAKNGIVAEDDGTLSYYVNNTKQYGLGLIELDGDYYYVNSNGVVVVGEYWVTMDNGLGYVGVQQFGSDGKMTVAEAKTGIITEADGTLAYYVNNVKQSDLGLINLDGDYYYVNSNGVVVVGEYWVTKDNGLGYTGIQQFGTDGKMVLEVIADDEGTEGLAYTLSDDGTYYSVTGYTGTATDVVIPAVYEGLEVKVIDSYAFKNCSSLTSVAIPDSVTSIGNSAFYGCSGLTSITIPDSVTEMGNSAFYKCSGLTAVYIEDLEAWFKIYFGYNNYYSNPLYYAGNLYVNGELVTDLVIPESVTSIGRYAFSGCTGITSVTIHESVTSIGESAFYGCSGLTAVYIEDLDAWCKIPFCDYYGAYYDNNPLEYAKNLYLNDELVTDLVIPNSVTSIEDYTFYGCTGLITVTMPDSVTSIGNGAFYGCSGLTAVYIEDLEAWFKISFGNASSNPLCYAGNLYLNGELVTDIVIPESVKSIGYTFSGCTSLTSVTIPNSVTSIGNSAFYRCTGLTSVTIPDSVTSIGAYTFKDCTGLASIIIPDSVTSIGSYAFLNCSSLEAVYIEALEAWCKISFVNCYSNPLYYAKKLYLNGGFVTDLEISESVTSIGSNAFYNCTSLTSVTIPDSVTSIGSYAFFSCGSLEAVYIEDLTAWCKISFDNSSSNPLKYAKNLYLNGELVTDLVIPESVTSIVDYAFCDYDGLTSVTIPASVTSIGSSAFYNCTSLTSVEIPKTVTTIGWFAFDYCFSLTSVEIPESVTTIGDSAFRYCISLTSITIPDSVTSIGGYAFHGCTGMTDIYCEAAEKPSGWNSSWLGDCYATVHWGYVPEAE